MTIIHTSISLSLFFQMAGIPEYEYDMPLLLVSWQFSVKPSNIILLESNVAIKVDQTKTKDDDNNDCTSYCFDIISTKESRSGNKNSKIHENNFYNTNNHTTTTTKNNNKNNSNKKTNQSSSCSSSSCSSSNLSTTSTLYNGKITKTFSTSKKEDRDEWVQKINETIEFYEKSKCYAEKTLRRMSSSSCSVDGDRLLLALPPTSPLRRSSSRNGGRRGNEERLDLSGLSISC